MIKVGILGSTGYAGQQLAWFLLQHSEVEIIFLSSNNYADLSYENVYKNYSGFIRKNCINIQTVENSLESIDVLFIALPSGKSFEIASKALKAGVKVIDLGADFRLKSPDVYKLWYEIEHQGVEALATSVYGLSELNRTEIKNASLIANPGCYPTASILAIAPLLKEGLIDPSSIIIDAKSGVSGAGRSANIANLYAECNESIKAYGVASHRHTPEIEQELSNIYHSDIKITFTPHLVPMNRGILATCYGNLRKSKTTEEIYLLYNKFYKNEFFIKILDSIPETRWVKGSNLCHIGLRVDKRTNRIVVVSAIDNLVKGAAGQAVQNMNIMFGLDENEGISMPAMMP